MADLSDILDTLIAEAYGEGPEGMRRVGETILNRAAIRGIDPAAVVRQPHQYTGYFAPGPAAIQAQQDPVARSAAEAAWQLARQPGDPTGGADHYKADYVNPYWADQMPKTGSFGAHDFYRSTSVPQDALARLLAPSAPTPFAPPERGNVPSDLVARSFANNSAAQARRNIADMFGPAINGNTPRLTGGGAVASPASISTDWAGSIFPDTRRRVAPVIAAQDLTRPAAVNDVVAALTQDKSLQDALRQRINSQGTTVATFPTAPAARAVPPMSTRVAQSYAGQDSIAPSTVKAVAALFPPQQTNAGVGKPPATRTVQSVPVPAARPSMSAPTAAQIRADNGQDRPAARAVAPAAAKPASRTIDQIAALYGNGGPTRPAAAPTSYNPAAHGFSGAGGVKAPVVPNRLPAGKSGLVDETTIAASGPKNFNPYGAPMPAPLDQVPMTVAMPVKRPNRPAAPQPTRVAITAPAVPPRRTGGVVAPAPRPAPMAFTQPRANFVTQAANAIGDILTRGRQPVPSVQRPAQQPAPISTYYTDPLSFGRDAVNQSGDTSVGNQMEAAAARASGEGGRNRRY